MLFISKSHCALQRRAVSAPHFTDLSVSFQFTHFVFIFLIQNKFQNKLILKRQSKMFHSESAETEHFDIKMFLFGAFFSFSEWNVIKSLMFPQKVGYRSKGIFRWKNVQLENFPPALAFCAEGPASLKGWIILWFLCSGCQFWRFLCMRTFVCRAPSFLLHEGVTAIRYNNRQWLLRDS